VQGEGRRKREEGRGEIALRAREIGYFVASEDGRTLCSWKISKVELILEGHSRLTRSSKTLVKRLTLSTPRSIASLPIAPIRKIALRAREMEEENSVLNAPRSRASTASGLPSSFCRSHLPSVVEPIF